MIASFFQRLEAGGVRYLLISGQATVLYGAATFSEDVDLWVDPETVNLQALTRALRDCGARYYKLTPSMTQVMAERGHGFHFVLPTDGLAPETYLDVLGQPPRVGSFGDARAEARSFDTDWGRVPTIGVRQLVEVKKTQRIGDYPIISRLVLLHLEHTPPDAERLDWALRNVMTVGDLCTLFRVNGAAVEQFDLALPNPVAPHRDRLLSGVELPEAAEDEIDAWLGGRITELRKADRQYWRPIIAELRELRRLGALMTEGEAV